jgi:hypothetical protein
MNTAELPAVWSGVLCAIIFTVALVAGDVAGLFIERKWRRQWEKIADKMGFKFYGRRSRWPALSNFLLPKLLLPGQRDSAFCYGEALKTLTGRVGGFDVTITDFAVWNFYSRSSLVFRAPVFLFKKDGATMPSGMALVKNKSMLLNGFGMSPGIREYRFPFDKEFSQLFVFFGQLSSTPWTFTAKLRELCVRHRKDIDSLSIADDDLLLVCRDRIPERFPKLVEFGITVMNDLLEDLPSDKPQSGAA